MVLHPDDVIATEVLVPGAPGTGFTAGEAATMRADMDTFLATTVPETIGDLSDVDTATTAPVDDDALIWDSTANGGAGAFVPGSAAGSLANVSSNGVDIASDVVSINFTEGLEAYTSTGNLINAYPTWGGTGSKHLVARSDHTHTTPTTTRYPYGASGTLSSGGRTLDSESVTLAAAGSGEAAISYLVDVSLHTCQRGNGGSSYYTLTITIDGTATTSTTLQCVGGVPDRPVHTASKTITGTGVGKTISGSITYSSGDPLTVDAGVLVIKIRPNR